MERFDEFTEFLASTALYAELNKEFTTFEIFEMTKGKFEILAVQETYERFLKQHITSLKRSQFNKDLNQMISSDYLLLPKVATEEMITEALLVIAVANGKLPLEQEIAHMWEKMVSKFQELKGATL